MVAEGLVVVVAARQHLLRHLQTELAQLLQVSALRAPGLRQPYSVLLVVAGVLSVNLRLELVERDESDGRDGGRALTVVAEARDGGVPTAVTMEAVLELGPVHGHARSCAAAGRSRR